MPRGKRVDPRRQRAYEAFLIFRATGHGYCRIRRAIEELVELGFLDAEVPPLWTVNDWCGGRIQEIETTPLIKAKYHYACEVAIELKGERPDWGATRIASEVRKRTGVPVPEMTAYYRITGRSRPNTTPLRIRQELGYAVGALMTGCSKEIKSDSA